MPTIVNLREMCVDQHGVIKTIGARGELGRRIRDIVRNTGFAFALAMAACQFGRRMGR